MFGLETHKLAFSCVFAAKPKLMDQSASSPLRTALKLLPNQRLGHGIMDIPVLVIRESNEMETLKAKEWIVFFGRY